jgi:hypothetical protein
MEFEKARQYAADLSEDLSEGEKGETNNEPSIHDESMRTRMPRIGSTDAIDTWANQHKDKKLYIVLIRYGALELIAVVDLDLHALLFFCSKLMVFKSLNIEWPYNQLNLFMDCIVCSLFFFSNMQECCLSLY